MPFCKIHPGSVKISHASHALIEEMKKNEPPLESRHISVVVDEFEVSSYILESEVKELEILLGGKFDKNGEIVLPLDKEWLQDNLARRIGRTCGLCLKEYRDSWRALNPIPRN